VRDNITTGNYRFAYPDTARTVVQIGDNVFAGVWDTTRAGSDMLLAFDEHKPFMGAQFISLLILNKLVIVQAYRNVV
jgi:hypothetical protein